ncbi:acetyl/propionyl/methylcrotonyl-CoA carboxylase subunit alpha [Pseudoxanthomonas sp.]|uniref:acetyl/propionyl/methylcrotonyl-CoA carboxylase subunit alpha n=1 Tax=Pseudoxanthomonas sp. TaxID=1871049 RepID=UPI00261AAEAD|nr:acetyl/propionyl/methylcrotonyl-CoA carboxylase subunit alpha [Pseudoxanthomonas sp.]WDS36923.1 MAG: acetyl/propionyl/methylcrotonyl-CoA carboxylase subunit alpha [Pseudoxanthomonas sp.]
MFTKILIANRGEIACRIIQTCRRMGIATVAIYSEADAGARHVRLADESFCVGPAASRDSYLRVQHIIQAARHSGAQAVHPGYGFLSENDAFADACAEAGIVFIGPPVESIRAMGSKSAAKTLMAGAGVPLVPGYHAEDQAPGVLQAAADGMGYPVLIKASAGGGGKGMRVVQSSETFLAALESCQREARTSFGDDRVLLEKYLQQPRHVEIQVFCDQHGNTISLNERDCSAQRRHQKVVEEAPAPGLDAEQRAAMSRAACDAARAVGYVGAGTVEFIVEPGGAFYFMEMNTRLQVEHPVTEMITGQDLVEWQLRVAAGEALPLTQQQVPLNGHAIEARIYAEEPEKGFLPSIGRLVHFRAPLASPHVRLDTGVEQGDRITPHYDPMIAKLIVWDHSREAAIERMLKALGELQIVGVGHNIAFLSRLIDHPVFRQGHVDTSLIERAGNALTSTPQQPPVEVFEVAALALAAHERDANAREPHSPWDSADGWRLNGTHHRLLAFSAGDQSVQVRLGYAGPHYLVDGVHATLQRLSSTRSRVAVGDRSSETTVVRLEPQVHVFLRGVHYTLTHVDPLTHAGDEEDVQGGLTAPMPGKIIALLVDAGSKVKKGQALLVMEAMKMEMSIVAPADGQVLAYRCAVDGQVVEGASLVDFEVST